MGLALVVAAVDDGVAACVTTGLAAGFPIFKMLSLQAAK
jgi:hypothetical protein